MVYFFSEMCMKQLRLVLTGLICIIPLFYLPAQRVQAPRIEKIIGDSLTVIARDYFYCDTIRRVKITPDKAQKKLIITANDDLGHLPYRKENVNRIYAMLHRLLDKSYPGYKIEVQAYQRDIRHLIPNYLRKSPTGNRTFYANELKTPAVKALDQPFTPKQGLYNRNIALWNSHGIHNLNNDSIWGWQRPNLFQTVEDLLTSSFVIPFLIPMLENAGAQVYLPRERDINTNEIIVDNDNPGNSRYREFNDRKPWVQHEPGFSSYKTWYSFRENPFDSGTYVRATTITDSFETSRIEWKPAIPVTGNYAVYISYRTVDNSTEDAEYSVYHSGGISRFAVNQTVNGKTWVYLGNFHFQKGRKEQGKVVLSNLSSTEGKTVTADAVRFGGGMGSVTGIRPYIHVDNKPVPSVSGYPRFAEGARYWLQWAGVPDSVYSRTQNTNHYSDDFQSRGFWVNYLREGLGIPVDLAFAFHTDAGTRGGDSIIGTLGICTVNNTLGDSIYKNGISRWAGRDMVDMIQSEIVQTIRSSFRSDWTRRGIWNRSYSESRVPEVPTMLLELLSHQNFEDMKFALDPCFRFTVSRAIYKGMLKYLAASRQTDYVVQPLPVERFSTGFISGNTVKLKWKATPDPLEPTSVPVYYIVYTRKNENGFDNGFVVNTDSVELKIESGIQYSFKITAVNEGGQSFPSEILSVYRAPSGKGDVLIINGFNRISGPENFNLETMAGFLNDKDAGVPYLFDLSFTGKQYDFSVNSPYIDMQKPGFGASERTHDGVVIAGNTFDYPALHGRSIKKAGYSFVSAGADALARGDIHALNYQVIDFIAGKQKQTLVGNVKKTPDFKTFPLDLQRKLREFTQAGGHLLVSGAYVASDIYENNESDKKFIEEVLHVKPGNTDIRRFGMIQLKSDADAELKINGRLDYFTIPSDKSYFAEETDVLVPVHPSSGIVGWYNGSNQPAIVVTHDNNKTVVMGFPFETITDEEERDKLMHKLLQYLFKK